MFWDILHILSSAVSIAVCFGLLTRRLEIRRKPPANQDRSEQIAAAMRRHPDSELRAAWLTENAVTGDELRAAWESFTQGPGPGAPLPTWPQHQREDLDR